MQHPDDLVPTSLAALGRPAPLGEDLPASTHVYRELLGRLVTRELAPGAKISVDGMSRALGVSQTPIREALSQLETEGLVTRIHLAGFRAAPLLARQQFDQLFEARLLIEPFLAGLAATRHSAEQAVQMEAAAERMRELAMAIDPPTYGTFAIEDAWLHNLIATAADNPLLQDALGRLHAHIHLFRLHYHARVPLDAIGEHDDLLAAIAERRPRVASTAMREYLEASRGRLQVAYE